MWKFIFIMYLIGDLKKSEKNESIPIYFSEYKISIDSIKNLKDTIVFNKSAKEEFKIVFFDTMGESYLEKYVNGKLYQKGSFCNSLDTLKRYVSGRSQNGNRTNIFVQSYFEPLKDGKWTTYVKGKPLMELYQSGVLLSGSVSK